MQCTREQPFWFNYPLVVETRAQELKAQNSPHTLNLSFRLGDRALAWYDIWWLVFHGIGQLSLIIRISANSWIQADSNWSLHMKIDIRPNNPIQPISLKRGMCYILIRFRAEHYLMETCEKNVEFSQANCSGHSAAVSIPTAA